MTIKIGDLVPNVNILLLHPLLLAGGEHGYQMLMIKYVLDQKN